MTLFNEKLFVMQVHNETIQYITTVALVVMVPRRARKHGVSGNFTCGDFNCKYRELCKSGPGPRELVLNCKHKDKNIKDKNFRCTYRGNPHNSSKYNKNQKKFYLQLAKEAADANGNLEIINSKICPGIKFERVDPPPNIEIIENAISPRGSFYENIMVGLASIFGVFHSLIFWIKSSCGSKEEKEKAREMKRKEEEERGRGKGRRGKGKGRGKRKRKEEEEKEEEKEEERVIAKRKEEKERVIAKRKEEEENEEVEEEEKERGRGKVNGGGNGRGECREKKERKKKKKKNYLLMLLILSIFMLSIFIFHYFLMLLLKIDFSYPNLSKYENLESNRYRQGKSGQLYLNISLQANPVSILSFWIVIWVAKIVFLLVLTSALKYCN
ncbi:hypothetical protein LOTGIDRAFT_157812 [Lottia gigantea]|uniref:Uncharacterized protein n=1 Tax=Lottia gigantea TaxID=225164 RepID=V4A983_LOTGI|nr:hypothetical protein LOTGIDRAFT_157812 [Lottia gigantea]ESP00539.1 hypothetical protein LOTGIDRAFT_157812 [Lottia gigantea]